MQLPLSRTRLGILAGVVGAAGALTFVAAAASESQPVTAGRTAQSSDEAPGDISGPCDEAEHANDPECAGVAPTNPGNGGTTPTTPTTPTTAPAAPAPSGGTHTVNTVGGNVTYSSNGTSVSLVSAMPANGWRVEVEQSSGREVELDFRSGSRRVQVNLEIEDGHVRERVRVRDDATGTDVRVEDGMVVRDDGGHGGDDGDDHGDNSGPGSSGIDNSGSGSSGSGSSGSGSSGGDDSGSRHSGGSDDDSHSEDD